MAWVTKRSLAKVRRRARLVFDCTMAKQLAKSNWQLNNQTTNATNLLVLRPKNSGVLHGGCQFESELITLCTKRVTDIARNANARECLNIPPWSKNELACTICAEALLWSYYWKSSCKSVSLTCSVACPDTSGKPNMTCAIWDLHPSCNNKNFQECMSNISSVCRNCTRQNSKKRHVQYMFCACPETKDHF